MIGGDPFSLSVQLINHDFLHTCSSEIGDSDDDQDTFQLQPCLWQQEHLRPFQTLPLQDFPLTRIIGDGEKHLRKYTSSNS